MSTKVKSAAASTLVQKIEQLETCQPGNAQMVEEIVRRMLRHANIPSRDDIRIAFITEEEKDIVEMVYDSLTDLAGEPGDDNTNRTYPEGTLRVLKTLLCDVLFSKRGSGDDLSSAMIAERFSPRSVGELEGGGDE
jgi:hypothetical protein